MTIHRILRMGDPRLLRVARPVTQPDSSEIRTLIADMFETMHAACGVGLAAPQIGVDLAVVIFGFTQSVRYPEASPVPQTVLINPEISVLDDAEDEDWEGCLSVPGLRGRVPRFRRIRYRGLNAHGQPIDREADGFHARVVQHECDHLIGKLYPMRIRDFSSFGFNEELFPGQELADD